MKLEQQVVSIEIAKRLKELGVRQESVYRWDESDGIDDRLEYMPEYSNKTHELVSAYTGSELGNMLPNQILVKGNTYWFDTRKDNKGNWYVCYEWESPYQTESDCLVIFHDDNEAICRGSIIIYLLENKLITL